MKMIIGGKKVDAIDGKTIDVINPATGEKIDTVPSASEADMNLVLENAQKGKKVWSETPLYTRCETLIRYAQLIEEHSEELAKLISIDTGKSIKEARGEMARIARSTKSYAERANHLYTDVLSDAQPGMEHDYFVTRREPLGVVFCVVPYNFPISLYTKKVVPALAMGNAVIIKPPTDSPLAPIRITELLLEAGVPGDAAQIITGRGSVVGDYIAKSPLIDALMLTGSTEVGLSVAENTAKNLVHLCLELGGNDAMIIFEDADIDRAAAEAAANRAMNEGQVCAAPKRFIVQNSIKDKFTALLLEKIKEIKIGDPADENTDVGCLINEKAAIEVEEQVEYTVKQGAKLLSGGKRYNKTFFPLTVLGDVTEEMDIAKDLEIFGPVYPIIGFDTEEDAIRIANSSKYGLAAGVLSEDYKKCFRVAEKIECGNVVINSNGNYNPQEAPFGGVKMSGVGREGVCTVLEELSRIKTYVLRGVR